MATQRALAALVVVVGVVALGAAAAGMDDPQRSGPTEGPGEGTGDGPPAAGDGENQGGDPGVMVSIPGWLTEGYMMLTVGAFSILGILIMAYIVWRERLEGLLFLLGQFRDVTLAIVVLTTFLALILWLGFDFSDLTSPPAMGESEAGGGGGDVEPEPDTGTGLPQPLVVLGVLALAAVVVVAVRRLLRSDDEDEPAEEQVDLDVEDPVDEAVDPTPPVMDLAEQAPDNPVYRAWYDLVTRVGLAHERNRTPDEVAEEAVQQGLPRDAVDTLTAVFSEVRYGHRPVTDERERRAESAMRSIEGGGGEA